MAALEIWHQALGSADCWSHFSKLPFSFSAIASHCYSFFPIFTKPFDHLSTISSQCYLLFTVGFFFNFGYPLRRRTTCATEHFLLILSPDDAPTAQPYRVQSAQQHTALPTPTATATSNTLLQQQQTSTFFSAIFKFPLKNHFYTDLPNFHALFVPQFFSSSPAE